ncbi:hypothetical protein C8Q73DRAFT_794985 [Cubamyces lactineus]|nr:hypothetical protein C8Q73DRAFT_794985 [Cubamyces lactineus]
MFYSESWEEQMSRAPPVTSDPALRQQLARLRAAFIHKRPFCQGTTALSREDGALFYGKGPQEGHCIDLANASSEELQHLAETCDPASFGIQQKDVYDESYRKAGKLDKGDFAINLSPDALGIVDAIRDELLVETVSQREQIRAELYKLNVYGPQSFFKPHVDTPRSELMFGSLVIIFPTPHEGGALILRDNGGDTKGEEADPYSSGTEGDNEAVSNDNGRREWKIDSGALLAQCSAPSIVYVAFFSDVEHEVTPVLFGYRVIITYNLFYVRDPSPATVSTRLVAAEEEGSKRGDSSVVVPPVLSAPEQILRSTLQSLLDNSTFVPEGGNLLFNLHYRYPLPTYRERIMLKTTRQQQL